MNEIPIWEKYALTISEAVQYFNLGDKKLRQLVQEYEDSDFLLHNGNKALIKREKFEEFLNKTSSV